MYTLILTLHVLICAMLIVVVVFNVVARKRAVRIKP